MDNIRLEHIKNLNFDGILDAFTYDHPDEIKKQLFCLYSTITEYSLSDDFVKEPALLGSMMLLRSICEGAQSLNDLGSRELNISQIKK